MELIRPFENLSRHDAAIAGGKGASLGEMTQAGIPVPPGFVVLSDAFERFLKETELDVEIDAALDTVNHKEIHTVENASERIQALILDAEMPKDIAEAVMKSFEKLGAKWVAVRSSATAEDSASAAWAGQLDSYLNTSKKDLLKKVQRCWASLFTPRAIFYRFEKDLHKQKISVAVVVQKMVESEVSGIAFSVHPVTQDYNQLIIEAGYGLGEAIVSGQITPDSYVVAKKEKTILEARAEKQERRLDKKPDGGNEWVAVPTDHQDAQKLTGKQILELSDLIIRIENHYDFPCDIEWAFEKGKFYITQSRPITTLSQNPIKNREAPTNVNGKEWNVWATRNIPFWNMCLLEDGFYWHLKDFGVEANLEVMAVSLGGTQTTLFVHEPNVSDYGAAVIDLITNEKKLKILEKKYYDCSKSLLESLEECNLNLTSETWKQFTDQYRRYSAGLIITTAIGRSGMEMLSKLLIENGVSKEKLDETISTISYPEEHTPLFNSQMELLRTGAKIQSGALAQNEISNALGQWLSEYRQIPVNFCGLPWSMENALEQLKTVLSRNCAESISSLKASHKKRIARGRELLRNFNNAQVTNLAHALAKGTTLNEFRKNVFSKVALECRGILSELARRGDSNDWTDCFFLAPAEMDKLVAGKALNIKTLKNQRSEIGIYVDSQGAFQFLNSDKTKALAEWIRSLHGKTPSCTPTPSEEISSLKGFSASKGLIRGIVKIILSPEDFSKLNLGEILVTTMTSVDFVPVMEKAGAFVTNEGGITSHAAIVAREMNKPCIIGTKIATQVLKDGDWVEVDADRGVVRKVEEGGPITTLQKIEEEKGLASQTKKPQEADQRVVNKIKSLKWERWLERPFNAFLLSTSENAATREAYEKIGLPGVELRNMLFQNSSWYYCDEAMEEMDAKIERYLATHSMTDITGSLAQFKDKSEKTIKSLVKNDNVAVEEKFREVFKILTTCLTYTWLAHGIESFYKRKLKEEVPRHIKGDVDQFIGDASFPKKKNAHVLLDEMLRGKSPSRAIAEKFGWIKARDGFSEPFTTEEIDRMRKELPPLKKNPKVKIPPALKNLFDEIQELVFFRTERTDILYRNLFLARPILKQLADQHGIPFGEMRYYRAKSFVQGRPERYIPLCSFAYADGESFFSDEPIIREAVDTHKNEVSGTVAYRGKATGVAKIVKKASELDKVKPGDILLTQMTFPSFIPAMNRASAFVTDEGGITCHAAIVAREMNKPCVIGTKIATQVFKDGDLIEVDADRGVVRKLEEAVETTPQAYRLWGTRYYSAMFGQGFCEYTLRYGARQVYMVPIGADKGNYTVLHPQFEQATNRIGEEFLRHSATLLRDYESAKQKIIDSAQALSEKAGKVSDVALLKLFKRYWELSWKFQPYMIFPHYTEKGLEPLLARKFPKEFPLITSIPRPTEHMRMHRSLLDSSPEKIAKEYGWLAVYGMTERPFDAAHFEEYRKLLKRDEVERQFKEIDENNRKYGLWAKTLKLEDRKLCDVLREFVYIRTDRIDTWKRHACLLYPFTRYLASKVGPNLDTREGSMLFREEIIDLLSGKSPVTAQELMERGMRDSLILSYSDEGARTIKDYQLKNFLIASVSQAEKTSEFKGIPSHPGLAQGIAKVYLNRHDIKDSDIDYILVCRHTSPQDLPVMKRAKAIVTDEGGVTCHAAIVSRELKIPCVVGTKVATQTLKSGDLIEVDADKGVVRKIENGEPITTLIRTEKTSTKPENIVEQLKKTGCQIDWAGPFSLFHYSLASNGYFKTFERHFGRSLSFIYLSFTNGVATAYLPIDEYESLGLHLAERARDPAALKDWIARFKRVTDDLKGFLSSHDLLDNLGKVRSLYDLYTAFQVATKTAANFLTKGSDRPIFDQLEAARKYSETLYQDNEKVMVDALKKAKRKIKGDYSVDQLKFATVDEIIEMCGGSRPISAKELVDRHRRCGVFANEDGPLVIDAPLAEEVSATWIAAAIEDGQIKGNSAYPGVVTGKCRVIKNYKSAKILKGEVLVTSMTDPNFVPLMEAAVAIVTDGGGLLCHAAIISREMKKPCVIGTKIATQVLKDGDLVEVDADKGVVRKIEENRPGQEPKLDIDTLASLKWHYVHKRIRTPFYMTLLVDGISQHNNPKLKFPYEVPVCVLNGDIAFPDEDWQRLKKIILGQLEIDQGFLLKLLHESYRENEAIESLAKRYQEIDTAKISPQKRLGLWKEYVQKSRAFGAYIILPLFIEPEMEAKLKKAIQKKFHGDKAEEVFQVLTTPTKPGAILQEEMNLLKLAMDKSKGKNISQALQKHLIDFAWIKNNSFDGSFYSAQEIEKRIQDAIKGDAQRKFQEHQEKIKEQKKKFDAFRKIVGDEPKMAGLIDTLQESIYFRSWRTERYYRNAYFLQGFFAGTAKALGLSSANDLFYWTPQEILERLEGADSLDKKKIEGRKEAYLLWTEENGTNIYSGPIVEKAQKKIRFLEIDRSREIKGQTAYPGVVSGKARIIFSVKELHKVQPGEILVTPSTTPNYVPILKRVKGIVTEEGGVLSHASVISRELKIPCVIGTKIATQILKDGDLVEVDADKGVVRKIEDALRRTAPISMDDLGSKNWKKNWAGGWSMLSCAYLGHQYTRQLKEAIGISLNEALFISHKGISSCYFIDEHKKTFGEHLVRQAELDPQKIKEWAKSLVRTTDGILALIETLKKQDATYDNFKAFLGKMYEYGVPHRIVKMAVDYLPEALLKKYLTDLTKARVHAEPVYAETENYMRHIAQKIYERIGLRPELVLAMTPDQFEACLHSGTAPSEKNLIEQYENSALYMEEGAKEFVVGEAAVGNLEKALTDKLTSANALIGQGAYPGKVTGRVVVVLDPTKGKAFSAGDILVTGMTRPEYLPFIERSAGFVTDAGGILSHAAITARELRKPAVIGTDIATQILKDGDLVEVDADKGVVRRVEEGEGNPLDIVEKVISDKNWIFLVGRPYTLFGASLYQRWFDPPQISKLFGISIPDNLYVEEHSNVVRRYVIKEQLDAFSNAIANLVKNDLKKAKQMAKKGLELSEQAKRYIKKTPFSDLNAAVDFLVELALYAAVFSYFAYPVAKEKNDMELVRMLEGLRSISYYPKVVEKIINPLAQKKAGADYNFMTISEIMAGDRSKVVLRKKASGQGKRFLYSKIDEEEDVQWVENVMGIIEKLERVRIGNSVKGQVAYPGKIVGRVRRVLTSNTDIEFDEGDILVVVTSNPTLMPLIRKCGAIVSDEGGITSHAAIVSRELKKPCVIGTKFATHSFKDGDLVEVDADKGVVRKINP